MSTDEVSVSLPCVEPPNGFPTSDVPVSHVETPSSSNATHQDSVSLPCVEPPNSNQTSAACIMPSEKVKELELEIRRLKWQVQMKKKCIVSFECLLL